MSIRGKGTEGTTAAASSPPSPAPGALQLRAMPAALVRPLLAAIRAAVRPEAPVHLPTRAARCRHRPAYVPRAAPDPPAVRTGQAEARQAGWFGFLRALQLPTGRDNAFLLALRLCRTTPCGGAAAARVHLPTRQGQQPDAVAQAPGLGDQRQQDQACGRCFACLRRLGPKGSNRSSDPVASCLPPPHRTYTRLPQNALGDNGRDGVVNLGPFLQDWGSSIRINLKAQDTRQFVLVAQASGESRRRGSHRAATGLEGFGPCPPQIATPVPEPSVRRLLLPAESSEEARQRVAARMEKTIQSEGADDDDILVDHVQVSLMDPLTGKGCPFGAFRADRAPWGRRRVGRSP